MKLGIALGGGGAKGFAHIGVLKALSEAGIDAQVVAGTSIGACVGAAYACGNVSKLEQFARSIGLKDIPKLLSPSWSIKGLFSGDSALAQLADFATVEQIEDLPMPFAAVSVDIKHAQLQTMQSGCLKTALRASFAIPGIFTPVELGENVLVDGGMIEPVPVKAARDLGAEFVIAVDLFGNTNRALPESSDSSFVSNKDFAKSLISVVELSTRVNQQYLTELRLKEHPADALIQPATSDVAVLDFHKGVPLIEVGYKAATELIPEIQERLGQ